MCRWRRLCGMTERRGRLHLPTLGGETGGVPVLLLQLLLLERGSCGEDGRSGGKCDTPPAGPNPFKAVGRFFKRLFGRG